MDIVLWKHVPYYTMQQICISVGVSEEIRNEARSLGINMSECCRIALEQEVMRMMGENR